MTYDTNIPNVLKEAGKEDMAVENGTVKIIKKIRINRKLKKVGNLVFI
jgi:hypothetical protein